ISETSDGADARSSIYPVPPLDEIGAVMRIDRGESVRVRDLDNAAIRGLTPAEDHDPRGGAVNGRTAWSFDIHSLMTAPEPAPTEARGHRARHGPGKSNPVNMAL